jgi:hypothetical protein
MWKTAGTALIGAATLAIVAPAAALAAGGQVSVNGSGQATVQAGATAAQQQSSYDQALNAAIGDASSKAQLIAGQLSLTLGPVLSVTEESYDSIGYCGVAYAPVVAPTASGVAGTTSTVATTNAPATSAGGSSTGTRLTPIPNKTTKHSKKHGKRAASRRAHRVTAHRLRPADDASQSCEIEADVTIVYATS